jgi:hypothetical protein
MQNVADVQEILVRVGVPAGRLFCVQTPPVTDKFVAAGMVAVVYEVDCAGVCACQSAKALGAIITTSASAIKKHTKIGYSFIFFMLKPPSFFSE